MCRKIGVVRWPYTRLSKAEKQSKRTSASREDVARPQVDGGGDGDDDEESMHSCAETLSEHSCAQDEERIVDSASVFTPEADIAQQTGMQEPQDSVVNGTLSEYLEEENGSRLERTRHTLSPAASTAAALHLHAESTNPRQWCWRGDLSAQDEGACDFAWLLCGTGIAPLLPSRPRDELQTCSYARNL